MEPCSRPGHAAGLRSRNRAPAGWVAWATNAITEGREPTRCNRASAIKRKRLSGDGRKGRVSVTVSEGTTFSAMWGPSWNLWVSMKRSTFESPLIFSRESEIRCQFIILARKDEPTPDYLRKDEPTLDYLRDQVYSHGSATIAARTGLASMYLRTTSRWSPSWTTGDRKRPCQTWPLVPCLRWCRQV